MCACGSIIRNRTLDFIIGSSDEYNFSEIILLLINKCVYGENPVNVLLLCGIGESYILALSYRIVPVPRMYALFVLYLVSPIGYTWTCNFNGFFLFGLGFVQVMALSLLHCILPPFTHAPRSYTVSPRDKSASNTIVCVSVSLHFSTLSLGETKLKLIRIAMARAE